MASVQYEKNEEIAMQLSFEEKASLDEIIKHAEGSLESQELLGPLNVVATVKTGPIKSFVCVAALRNQTKEPLSVMDSKIFEGHIVKNFPNPLKGTGIFCISGKTEGVKVAVVYSGKNKAGVECGWLLAFGNTNATGMKIYAECGRKDKFKNINWEQVKKNLDKAGIFAKPSDKETGTSLCATIVGTGGKSIVGAAFLG